VTLDCTALLRQECNCSRARARRVAEGLELGLERGDRHVCAARRRRSERARSTRAVAPRASASRSRVASAGILHFLNSRSHSPRCLLVSSPGSFLMQGERTLGPHGQTEISTAVVFTCAQCAIAASAVSRAAMASTFASGIVSASETRSGRSRRAPRVRARGGSCGPERQLSALRPGVVECAHVGRSELPPSSDWVPGSYACKIGWSAAEPRSWRSRGFAHFGQSEAVNRAETQGSASRAARSRRGCALMLVKSSIAVSRHQLPGELHALEVLRRAVLDARDFELLTAALRFASRCLATAGTPCESGTRCSASQGDARVCSAGFEARGYAGGGFERTARIQHE